MPNIMDYALTGRMAKHVRKLIAFGNYLQNYVPGESNSRIYPGFGNGTGYTVANWISDGYFANLAEVQSVFSICQSTSDTVDWVLLQTMIDDTIYGNMGNTNYGATVGLALIKSGLYICNRPLHIGYGRTGTPPSNLNGNGYVSITLKGDRHNVDSSGNGMTGVTIRFTCQHGIVSTLGQDVQIEDITIIGPHSSFYQGNLNVLHDPQVGNLDLWKPTGIADANWIGGAAVSIGIGSELYSNSGSAAAMPARPLPALFGGGTTTAVTGGGAGGTGLFLKNVNIIGFVIGYGHPHGDSNGEFIQMDGGSINYCCMPFVCGHSQGRNNSLRNINCFSFHTVLGNRGGTRGNANLQGSYINVHAGYGYQMFYHPNADWSGPLTLRDWYTEGTHRFGTWAGLVTLDNCYFSCWEIDGIFGVQADHYEVWHLVINGGTITGLRHGLIYSDPGNKVTVTNGAGLRTNWSTNWANHTNVAKITEGLNYMNGLLHFPGFNARRFGGNENIGRFGFNDDTFIGNYPDLFGSMTYLDQESTDFNAGHPFIYAKSGTVSYEMAGPTHRFAVPKITAVGQQVYFISRSGLDLVCSRITVGSVKADVGDYICMKPNGATEALRKYTWFVVVSVTSTEMTLRQQTNYFGSSQYDYQTTNGNYQFNPSTGEGCSGSEGSYYGTAYPYICTRIRQHRCLWIGDVTSGSNVISNIRNAQAYGSADDFVTGNFYADVGDFHLHHEIERGNTGGSGLKVQNKITAIDFSANTITLTENFNITRTNYPLPFYIRQYTD